jgi:hypothetical protein
MYRTNVYDAISTDCSVQLLTNCNLCWMISKSLKVCPKVEQSSQVIWIFGDIWHFLMKSQAPCSADGTFYTRCGVCHLPLHRAWVTFVCPKAPLLFWVRLKNWLWLVDLRVFNVSRMSFEWLDGLTRVCILPINDSTRTFWQKFVSPMLKSNYDRLSSKKWWRHTQFVFRTSYFVRCEARL